MKQLTYTSEYPVEVDGRPLFAFGIGNALPAAARYSRADELAIPNGARSNREVNFNENWKFF